MISKILESITWLGHDGFMIRDDTRTIVIDPYKISGGEPADIILITHDHYDHCSPEDIDKIGDGAVALLGLAKKLSDPEATDFLEKIADLPSKVDLAGAKPVGPFGMLGALSSKEARQGLGVLMELTKAMGSLKNGGGSARVEEADPIA